MKVVLVNPRATYAGEIAQKCYPPLSLMYLGASLLKAGHEVDVIDANAVNLTDEQIAAAVEKKAPGLAGMPLFSTISSHVYGVCSLIHSRCPEVKLILGGPEATAIPERTLTEFQSVDFVLRGESESSIVKLCDTLDRDGSLGRVRGLSYRRRGKIVHNADSEPAGDLDSLPRPARHLTESLYDRKVYYTVLVKSRPVDTLITSRGCPFRCGFCYNRNHTYRFRSPEDVLDELCEVRRRGVRDVEICDDSFTVNRARVVKIFELMCRERLGMRFRIKSRVNVVDRDLLKLAKRAGVYQIAYGMESGVQEILDRMNKRIKVSQIAEACRLTKQAGIMCHGSFVIGYPGETPDTIKRTLDFVVATKPSTVNFVPLIPFPQTTVYEEAKSEGMLVGDWRADSDYIPWVKLPWMESRVDLERCCRVARRRLYFRPYYALLYGSSIVTNANSTLARYMWQEAVRTIRTAVGPKLL